VPNVVEIVGQAPVSVCDHRHPADEEKTQAVFTERRHDRLEAPEFHAHLAKRERPLPVPLGGARPSTRDRVG